MPAPLISREEALDRVTRAFRKYGYEGASLAQLSAATGLVKASLYHHFPGGKEAMAAAALDYATAHFREMVIAPLQAEGPPDRRLRKALAGLGTFYEGGAQACLLGVFSVGEARDRFGARIGAGVKYLEKTLADFLTGAGLDAAEAAERAEDAVVRIQGALVVAHATGDQGAFQRTLERLSRDLLAK